MRWRTVIAFLIGGLLGGLFAVAIQSMIDSWTASMIKRSMADARSISAAIERYKDDTGRYPQTPTDDARLSLLLTPKYLPRIPTDGYSGKAFVVAMNGATPVVISVGRGGFIVQNREFIFLQPYRPGDAKR